MKKIFYSLSLLIAKFILIAMIVFVPFAAYSQCKGFAKKQIPKLAPFIHNGQVNSSVLLSGDNAELTLTFYSGQTYRIYVSSQEQIGDVYFVMKDANENNVLFSSKDQGNLDYWDFTVESTRQITILVMVPEEKSETGIVASGCVSILVGFKQ